MHLRSNGLGTVRPTPGSRPGVPIPPAPERTKYPDPDGPCFYRHLACVRAERVGARSPGPCPSLSVTLSTGITPSPTFDPAPTAHAGAGARYAARGDVECGSHTVKI